MSDDVRVAVLRLRMKKLFTALAKDPTNAQKRLRAKTAIRWHNLAVQASKEKSKDGGGL